MYCRVKYPCVFVAFLGVTLDCAETPFAKTPFSWVLMIFHQSLDMRGLSDDCLLQLWIMRAGVTVGSCILREPRNPYN